MALNNVVPGSPQKLTAADWNLHNDAARAYLRGLGRPQASFMTGGSMDRRDPVIVTAIASYGDVDQFGVVALDTSFFDPALADLVAANALSRKWRSKIVANAVAPDWTKSGRMAIALEPIASGRPGKFVVAGLVQCLVTCPLADWAACDKAIMTSAGTLQIHPMGNVQVLWRASGEVDEALPAIVRIAAPLTAEPQHVLLTLDAGTPAPSGSTPNAYSGNKTTDCAYLYAPTTLVGGFNVLGAAGTTIAPEWRPQLPGWLLSGDGKVGLARWDLTQASPTVKLYSASEAIKAGGC
jgi:hypothetical protein